MIASQTVPGATNDGQYHFGYQTPDRRSAPLDRRHLRRRLGVAGAPAGLTLVSVSSLDLCPGVQPHLVDLWRELVGGEVLLEHVFGDDRVGELLRDDVVRDQLLGVDRRDWWLVTVPVHEVAGAVLLVEHEVDEFVR